ncbi:MAG: hypothetical protein ACRD0G_15615 [Acidimicrobiales bacterium]
MGAAEEYRVSDGAWFVDSRTPVRRMRVSWHVERRLVVISFWQGDACTGTFRMPVADAARLIPVLSAALGAAAEPPPASESNVVPLHPH